jgi:hypothetical protein
MIIINVILAIIALIAVGFIALLVIVSITFGAYLKALDDLMSN